MVLDVGIEGQPLQIYLFMRRKRKTNHEVPSHNLNIYITEGHHKMKPVQLKLTSPSDLPHPHNVLLCTSGEVKQSILKKQTANTNSRDISTANISAGTLARVGSRVTNFKFLYQVLILAAHQKPHRFPFAIEHLSYQAYRNILQKLQIMPI